MGRNTNIGADASLTVYGNPESFRRVIKNHGVLAKIKQALICPCNANNYGSADYHCDICNGDGIVYTYQRRFMVSDEISQACGKTIQPFWNPIIDVVGVQNLAADVQGGITDYTVESFDDTTITVSEDLPSFQQKRSTYYFDGWTYVAADKLIVDADNGIMTAPSAIYDAGRQSSNPLKAFADIAEIVKIWNIVTGEEVINYSFYGNTIITKETIVPDQMYAEYYISDLTQVIPNDLATKNDSEVYTHELSSGVVRMAFYPFWDLSRGDIITLVGTVLYKNEQFTHLGKELDQLWEMEIFNLNDVILDSESKKYYINTDYILQGRNIKWISDNKPKKGSKCSVRYGYKPSFIVFEDNPQENNLENKQYPKIVMTKSWTKIDKKEVARLSGI
jgi:hypothetical protein